MTHPHEKRLCTIVRVPSFGPKVALIIGINFGSRVRKEQKDTDKNAGNAHDL